MAELGQTQNPQALIPGDPTALREMASTWRSRAQSAQDSSRSLNRVEQDLQGDWEGMARQAYEAKNSRIRSQWDRAATALNAGGAALDEYSHELEYAQRQAQDAIELWNQADPATAKARALFQSVVAGNTGAGPQPPTVPESLRAFSDPGESLRNRAREILSTARTHARRHAEAAAAKIRQAGQGASTDPPAARGAEKAWRNLRGHPGQAAARLGYLKALSALPPEVLAQYMANHPERRYQSLGIAGDDAIGQRAWWESLAPDARASMIAAAPVIVGNLNGVPYGSRDEANRRLLDLIGHDSALPQDLKEAAAKTLSALRGPDRHLVSFDPNLSGKPFANLSVGDLDKAQHVTVIEPGMTATVKDWVESWTRSAQNLHDRQVRLGSFYGIDGGGAVVASLDYDTPGLPTGGDGVDLGVIRMDKANAGAPRMASFLDGIQETLSAPAGSPHVNVVAHSYGTTTSSVALTQVRHSVDSAVFLGSAGIDQHQVANAAAMRVNTGADGTTGVWAAHATSDLIAPGGILLSGRTNPTQAEFGAHVFTVEGGYDNGQHYNPVGGHDPEGSSGLPIFSAPTGEGYLDLQTQSLDSTARITLGLGNTLPQLGPNPAPLPSPAQGGKR